MLENANKSSVTEKRAVVSWEWGGDKEGWEWGVWGPGRLFMVDILVPS